MHENIFQQQQYRRRCFIGDNSVDFHSFILQNVIINAVEFIRNPSLLGGFDEDGVVQLFADLLDTFSDVFKHWLSHSTT